MLVKHRIMLGESNVDYCKPICVFTGPWAAGDMVAVMVDELESI